MFYTDRSKDTNLLLLLGYELVSWIVIGLLYYALFHYLQGVWKLLVFFAVMAIYYFGWFDKLAASVADDKDFDTESDYVFVRFLSAILEIGILFAYLVLVTMSLYQGLLVFEPELHLLFNVL